MTTKLEPNGQVGRRTLASQLDRLDGILDGLNNGLTDSVANAVKGAVGTAVKEALQAVLTEVLTNPALLEHLQPQVPPMPTPPEPPCEQQPSAPSGSLLSRVRAAGTALGERVRKVASWARRRLTAVVAVVGIAAAAAGFLFRPKLTLLAGWVAGKVSGLLARLGLKRTTATTFVT